MPRISPQRESTANQLRINCEDETMNRVNSSGALVLVVDDEGMVNELLVAALQFHGFAVCSAANGTEAMRAVEKQRPNLVVLDVNLPDFDGFEVCRRMRAYGHDIPVIFLTARNESDSMRAGFERGGDDYLTKPFRVDELVLRIRAVLRRTGIAEPTHRIVCGDLEIDERSMVVSRSGTVINLSPTEYRMLVFLAVNRNNVVSKYQILAEVWGDTNDGTTTLVETYIGYLRRKLGSGPLLQTVRGAGYVLRSPSTTPEQP
jgi:two-component system, OmpR family, response regulator